MKKIIKINDTNLWFILKISRRARMIRLSINKEGELFVTVPYGVNEKIAEDFIIKKSDWVFDKINYIKSNPNKITIHTSEEIKKYKKIALSLVSERLKHWNKFYNFNYKKITIKNTKSRWGSCSKIGNINFNYKVALLSRELLDYIVVHELCHIGEMNHSDKFWKLVSMTIPNHKDLRNSLKNKF